LGYGIIDEKNLVSAHRHWFDFIKVLKEHQIIFQKTVDLFGILIYNKIIAIGKKLL
jgi:hypothetical protein